VGWRGWLRAGWWGLADDGRVDSPSEFARQRYATVGILAIAVLGSGLIATLTPGSIRRS
jgi:hypothetical protein